MPTSKICGQCAACHKIFVQGEEAIFTGRVRIFKDKLEPGTISCYHDPQMAVEVSHIQSDERGLICKGCWSNIRSLYFDSDKTHSDAIYNGNHEEHNCEED